MKLNRCCWAGQLQVHHQNTVWCHQGLGRGCWWGAQWNSRALGYPAKAGRPNAAGLGVWWLGSMCGQGMKGWEHLVPPGDLISAWIPSSVRIVRLYCPLWGSISPLVEKINPNPNYGTSDLYMSEFLNKFLSLNNRKRDLDVAEVVWCEVGFHLLQMPGLGSFTKEGLLLPAPLGDGREGPRPRTELANRSKPPGVAYSWSGTELIIRKKVSLRPPSQPGNSASSVTDIFDLTQLF